MTAQPLEARKRISQAAFRLFGRKGYTCTSVQDIANAAEVKKSIVYYYFRSKEGLYQALLSESSAHLETFLAQALTGVGLCHPVVTGLAPLSLVPQAPTAAASAGASVGSSEPALGRATAASGSTATAPKDCKAKLCAIAEMLIGLARDNGEPVRFFLTHIFAPDADRPSCSTDQLEQLPRQLIHELAVAAVHSGELFGEPSELERLVLGAVQYSIIRHLRNPEQEPLAAGLGQRIVQAAVRGFTAQRAQSPRRRAAAASPADADSV